MAESKRNSTVGKVATPRAGSGSPAMQPLDTMDSIAKAIGAKVRIITAAPQSQTFEGSLFTADPVLNIVAINTRNPPSATIGDYHILPVSRIQTFQILNLTTAAEAGDVSITKAQPAIGPVNINQLKQREETRIRKLRDEEQDRGKGVSKEGQAIFDALKRINMPVRWHETQIVAYEAVIIGPPYRPEDAKGPADKVDVVTRVKKVLDGERRKLKDKEERGAMAPTGPRKGG